ncbi:MAG: hypothetical protein AAGA58_09945 [Verrucomicrobiota bacterium]
MILDDIIAAIAALFTSILQLGAGIAMVGATILNFFLFLLESLIGLFVSGFKVGRVETKREISKKCQVSSWITLAAIVGALLWVFAVPAIMNREITFIADDGHTLPMAGVVIETTSETLHDRTTVAGKVTIPRFSTKSLSLKDSRYVETTWQGKEIESTLIAKRTVLGSSLDKLSGMLLKAADE